MYDKYSVLIDDCVCVESYLYFFAQNCNALLSYNLNGGDDKIRLVGRIPDEHILGEGLVSSIIHYNGRLFLTPKKMKANKVWIFNLQTSGWDSIDIDLDNTLSPMEKIAYSIIYNEELVMVGCYYNGIVRVNMNTHEVTYYKNVLDTEYSIHSLFYCVKDGNYLLIPSPNRNIVNKLNLVNYECEKIIIGNDKCAYLGICKNEGCYWLVPRKNVPYIVKWDGNNIYEYEVPEIIKKNGEYYFCRISNIANQIYMVGGYGKNTLIVNEDFSEYIVSESIAFIKKINEDCYIIQDYQGNIDLSYKEHMINVSSILEVDEICDKTFGNIVFRDIIIETKKDSLGMFINMIN